MTVESGFRDFARNDEGVTVESGFRDFARNDEGVTVGFWILRLRAE